MLRSKNCEAGFAQNDDVTTRLVLFTISLLAPLSTSYIIQTTTLASVRWLSDNNIARISGR
jgi:hypothetical protein